MQSCPSPRSWLMCSAPVSPHKQAPTGPGRVQQTRALGCSKRAHSQGPMAECNAECRDRHDKRHASMTTESRARAHVGTCLVRVRSPHPSNAGNTHASIKNNVPHQRILQMT
eukprot:5352301-Pleurochrysis_carterae.AAC.2